MFHVPRVAHIWTIRAVRGKYLYFFYCGIPYMDQVLSKFNKRAAKNDLWQPKFGPDVPQVMFKATNRAMWLYWYGPYLCQAP